MGNTSQIHTSLQAMLKVKALVSLEGSKYQETKTKASGVLNVVHNIDFICGMMILKNMFKVKMLSDYLQGEIINVAGALIALCSTDAVDVEFDESGEPHSEISEAANVSLKLTRQHGLFKYASRVYQLFLTAAPSVCKNERAFSTLKMEKLSSQ